MNETEEYWKQKHGQRKQEILKDLEKYFKVRNKSKIEILNLRFDYEIQRLQAEVQSINQILEVIYWEELLVYATQLKVVMDLQQVLLK